MKKLLAFLLSMALIFTLCACADNDIDTNENEGSGSFYAKVSYVFDNAKLKVDALTVMNGKDDAHTGSFVIRPPKNDTKIDFKVGDIVMITYSGTIAEIYPPSITAETITLVSPEGSTSTFKANVLEVKRDNYYLIEPLEGTTERLAASQIYVSMNSAPDTLPNVGDTVEILHSGYIMETFPAKIDGVFDFRVAG